MPSLMMETFSFQTTKSRGGQLKILLIAWTPCILIKKENSRDNMKSIEGLPMFEKFL